MNAIKKLIIFVNLLLISHTAFAVTIHQCKDEDGKITFQDFCPPGSVEVGSKEYGKKVKEELKIDITIYMVPKCKGCKELFTFFDDKSLSYTEKNIQQNLELQKELESLTGALQVPTSVINGKIHNGFDDIALTKILTDLGWKEEPEPY